MAEKRHTVRQKPRLRLRRNASSLFPPFSSSKWVVNNSSRTGLTPRKPRLQFEWADAISSEQWKVYRRAIQVLRDAGIRFLLGGGFALATYTGRWRNTKDIDFYILKRDREATVRALTEAGFADYFAQLPYDRKWIYRSSKSGVIVDIIWAMANQRAEVDEHWFETARHATVRGEPLRVVPMEEFVWCKLYILQRDRRRTRPSWAR